MTTKTQEEVLAFLLTHTEEQFTIHGIAKKLKKSYTLVYNNLIELEKLQIIKKENVPPGITIKLNDVMKNDILVNIEMKIKQNFLKKHQWVQVMLDDTLKYIKNPFFILIVFGSYAKEKETSKSDIDLLLIVDDKKNINKIEDSIKEIYTKVKKNITIVDTNDFKEMIANSSDFNVGNEVKKHHVLLFGTETYYNIIKR